MHTALVAHWTKTNNGYRLGGHRLIRTVRDGKPVWTLHRADGVTFPLGRKASFDTAEAHL